MLYRRAAGILAALVLIPQLLRGSEVACPRHGEDHGPAAVASTSMEGHEHHHQSASQNTAPSEHHAPSDCCPAMSTCAGGTALQVVDNALSLWSLHNDAPVDVTMLSRSRVESPDPPPPRA